MTYAKLIDDFPEHPKVVGLSDQAFRLYVTALCYASRNLTDGAVPAGIIKRLGATTKALSELLAANLWHVETDPPLYRIHDYLHHQRSRLDVEGMRQAKVLAGAKGGAATAAGRSVRSKTVPRGQRTTTDTETDLSSPSSAREWFVALNHRSPPNDVFEEILKGMDSHGPKCLRWAFEQSAAKDDPWQYGKSILDRCALEGHGPREKRNGRASSGAGTGGRAVRQGDGRGVGASQRVAGSGVDYAAEQREHEARLAAAGVGTPGIIAGEMEQNV